jgi:phage terminase small subunit
MQSDMVRVDEAMVRLDCSQRKAYEVLKRLNDDLKKQGFITISGRVPRAFFEKRLRIEVGTREQNSSKR